jgi:hypothetical protein
MAKKRKAKTKRKKRLAAMRQGMMINVFEDLDQAQKAMDSLLYAGIRPGQIWCSARGDDTGMFSSLENLDLPDQEAAFYSRACAEGHAVMIVQATDRQSEVSALLLREGRYDFSAHALQIGGHDALTVEYEETPLAQYTVRYQPDKKHFKAIPQAKRFETPYRSPQGWLWELDDTMWSLAKRLPDYAPRKRRREKGASVQLPLLEES